MCIYSVARRRLMFGILPRFAFSLRYSELHVYSINDQTPKLTFALLQQNSCLGSRSHVRSVPGATLSSFSRSRELPRRAWWVLTPTFPLHGVLMEPQETLLCLLPMWKCLAVAFPTTISFLFRVSSLGVSSTRALNVLLMSC